MGISEQELELELKKLKELNTNIIEVLKKRTLSLQWVEEYERAVREYEDAKNKLWERLQR